MPQLAMWLMVAALGQAPDATGWLDVVPAEADVVVRVRGVELVRDDLIAMLRATSPALGEQAAPALEQSTAQFRAMFGEAAATQPFLMLLRAVKPDDPASPPFAVVVKSGNLEGVLKGLSGGKAPTLKREDGGIESFDGPQGSAWYTAKGEGTVAFGPDKTLVAKYARPGGTALAKTLAPALQKRLLGGDLGLYVNLKALDERYGNEIAQAKEGLMAALDQAGKQAGNAQMMEMVKSMYGGMFDSLKEADALALSLDFSGEGLSVDGDLSVKADSAVAKRIAGATSGDPSAVAKLPADAAYFVYMNLDPKTFESFQKMGMSMLSPGGKPTPEVEAALAKQRGLGRVETIGTSTIANGMRTFNVITVSDPKALVASSEAMMKAMKDSDSPLNFIKEIAVTPNAETYAGFTFTRVVGTIDEEKLAKLAASNPGGTSSLKAMFAGDRFSSWYGAGDRQTMQIMAPSWADAKALIDAYTKGDNTLGDSPGFRAARAKLPSQANFLMLLSTQGLVRQLGAQFSAKVPDDLPKEPALIGVSLTTRPPTGFEFHLVIPSAVGPVFEKGMVPMLQNIKPPMP